MGYDFTKGFTKQDVINDQIAASSNGRTKTLEFRVVGSTLWAIKETGSDRWISCAVLANHRGFGWGCKVMDEETGPFNYNCPLEYLAKVPVASQTWRDEVIEFHRRAGLKLKLGDRVQLIPGCSIPELTVISLKPLRGQYNGLEFAVPRKLIAGLAR
jgi:hypothetical protein